MVKGGFEKYWWFTLGVLVVVQSAFVKASKI